MDGATHSLPCTAEVAHARSCKRRRTLDPADSAAALLARQSGLAHSHPLEQAEITDGSFPTAEVEPNGAR